MASRRSDARSRSRPVELRRPLRRGRRRRRVRDAADQAEQCVEAQRFLHRLARERGVVRHAVLTVATDQGDYVLDSLKDDILTTDKADYVWVERQDRASPTGWVALR